MDRKQFVRWLDRIYSTCDTEIDCERLQAFLAAYADFEIAGDDPGAHLPQAKAHLAQCPDCAEEYEGLRRVAELEARGRLPPVEESLAKFGAETMPAPGTTTPVPAP